MLTEERRASLLAYCKLTEFSEDPEVESLIPQMYGAAVGYMAQAGIAEPAEGTARRAQYDLCINHLVLDSWDRREITISGNPSDNPAFRRTLNQLKLTKAASGQGAPGG